MLEQKIPIIKKEDKAEITKRMTDAGYSFDETIKIEVLRQKHPELKKFLLKKTQKNKMGLNISKLLDSAGFKTHHTHNLVEKFIDELKSIYPLEMIDQAIANRECLPRYEVLKKTSRMINLYYCRKRRQPELPSLRTLLDSLYPEKYPHLSMLVTGFVRLKDLSVSQVREVLRKGYYDGKDIAVCGLDQLEGGIFLRWVNTFSVKRDIYGKGHNRTATIADITGIDPVNFSMRDANQIKALGNLSEYLTRIMLNTTLISNPDGSRQTSEFRKNFLTPITGVYPAYEKHNERRKKPVGVKLTAIPNIDGKERIYADVIVETPHKAGLVEVKNLRCFNKEVVRDLENRLSDERELSWSFRDKKRIITKKTIVVHSKEQVFERIKEYFAEKNFSLFSPSDFRSSLEIALEEIRKAGYLRTNVYSPEEILAMYDVLAEKPHILIRRPHRLKYEFFKRVTNEMLYRVSSGQKAGSAEPLEIHSVPGKIVTNSEGMFEHFSLLLNNLNKLHVNEYVCERISRLPENALFMDIETTGFINQGIIFLIGTAYKQENNLRIDIAFARNPWEEKAILKYFCTLAQGKTMITFNGLTFDAPFISKRLVSNMMAEQLPAGHIDMYRELEASGIRERYNLESLSLDSLLKYLFGDKPNGASGREVPSMYRHWLGYGKPLSIKPVIERNVKDLTATAALYLSPDLYKRTVIYF